MAFQVYLIFQVGSNRESRKKYTCREPYEGYAISTAVIKNQSASIA